MNPHAARVWMLAGIVLLTATRAPFARQADAALAIVPLPAKVERGRGVFTLTATTVIVADAPVRAQVRHGTAWFHADTPGARRIP